jgi:drug/metabolite transporter (DMT)-like permease
MTADEPAVMTEGSDPSRNADEAPRGLAADIERFMDWRAERPFRGGVLLILGGSLVALPALLIIEAILIVGAGRSVLSLAVGGLLVCAGTVVLLRPELSMKVGVAASVLAVTSLLSSFGGYLVGALLSSAGAVLCFAWQPAENGPVDDDAAEE